MNTPKNFDQLSRGLAHTTSRRQALKLVGGGLLGGMVAGAGLTAAKDVAAQGGPQGGPGSLVGVASGTIDGVPFTGGKVEVTRFTNQGGVLTAAANLFDAAGDFLGAFTAPVNILDTASCTILELTLGPLDLNLLGLMIHLDQVYLLIEAVPGGGLLGDLLCAVANLLNGGGPLQQLAGLLNRILAALGG